jgi:hypothetical protein
MPEHGWLVCRTGRRAETNIARTFITLLSEFKGHKFPFYNLI